MEKVLWLVECVKSGLRKFHTRFHAGGCSAVKVVERNGEYVCSIQFLVKMKKYVFYFYLETKGNL